MTFVSRLNRMILRPCSIFLVLLMAPALWAQPANAPNADNLYHWAYGAAFGTGAYKVGGDRIYTLRVMPSFEMAAWEHKHATLNLNLPVSIGVQDINLGGIRTTRVDEVLQTISFVPGLDLVWYPYQRWRVKPFAHLGWGTEMGGSESARIYFGGINSRYTLTFSAFDMDLLNGVHWMGYHPNHSSSERLSRLITGLEWEIPLGHATLAQQPALLRPHIAHFWYVDNLGFAQIQQSPVELKQEFEIGLALGTKDRMSFGFFKFDRVGLAYRTSPNIEGVRLFFGSIMD